jgi:hypothetical protein
MILLATVGLLSMSPPLPCGQSLVGDLPAADPPPSPVILGPGGPKLERDPFGIPNSLASANFRVLWGNANPIDATQAMALLDALEHSWNVEILDMGHPQPAGTETFLYNAYVADTGDGTPESAGTAGFQTVDPEGYSMLVMARSVVAEGGGVSDGTAAHEFYHAVQNATGRFPYEGVSAWFWEATAVWVEQQVFPEHPGYATFLFGYAFLPQYPLSFFDYFDTGVLTEYRQYGAFIFPHYLTQEVADFTLIRDTWLDPTNEPDPLVVIAARLDDAGLDFNEVWLDHVAHNVLWDYEDHDNLLTYAELYADQWPESMNVVVAEVPAEGTDGFVLAPAETFPRRYGSNAIRMQTPTPGNLRVGVHGVAVGDDGNPAHWGGRIVREFSDHIEYERIDFVLDEFYEGEALVEGVGDEQAIWLVVGAWTDPPAPFGWVGEDFGFEYSMTPELAPDPMGTTGGSSDGGSSDEGASGGLGSSGGLDSSTGLDGVGSSSGTTGETEGAPATEDDSGCGCTTTPRPREGMLVLLLLGATRRRRGAGARRA